MRFSERCREACATACAIALGSLALWARGAEQPPVKPTFDYNESKSFAELTNSIREITQRLEAAEKTLGSKNPNVAKLLGDLAGAYDDIGDRAQALRLDERCLSIVEVLLGPEHMQVADALNDLAWEYEHIGDYEKALPLFERSLAITEKLLGPEHFEVATSLSNMADLSREMGDYTRALRLCQRALQIRQKVLGQEHPDLVDSLDSLAEILRGLGACEEALAACLRSLAIGEKTLGPDSPLVAEALFVMGGVRSDLGQYPEASSAYQRALAIDEKISGPDHPDVMGNPDFDLDLSAPAVARARAHESETDTTLPKPSGLALTRTLSRDYRGMGFKPLPGSEAEARSVAKLLGEGTILKIGADAREAELKAVMSPRVLHLATHGFFLSDQEFRREHSPTRESLLSGGSARQTARGGDWENPLVRCGIALAGANHAGQLTNAVAEDGLLTGLEASLLNLQGTELVILSACDSGAGEVRTGEGVMSLRRAFRIAGAETVLASHWKVNDAATRRLMTEFIRRWRSGEPRAEAWRGAQLSLLHSEEFANPCFWAAFTLTGDWR